MKGVRAVAGGEATSRMSKEGERLTTSMRKKEQELDQRGKETCKGGAIASKEQNIKDVQQLQRRVQLQTGSYRQYSLQSHVHAHKPRVTIILTRLREVTGLEVRLK